MNVQKRVEAGALLGSSLEVFRKVLFKRSEMGNFQSPNSSSRKRMESSSELLIRSESFCRLPTPSSTPDDQGAHEAHRGLSLLD